METFYWNDGFRHVDVYDIEKLLELNQEEINLLATGPQDLFNERLEQLNFELDRKGIEKIDVTPAWNWKPGSYDKVKEYMSKRLWLDKKVTGMDRLFDRTKDRANYIGYIQRQAREMEFERANLKRLGVSKDVDIEKWTEKTNEYCQSIIDKCKQVYEATNEKVLITPLISEITNRRPNLYLDIELKDLVMQIHEGEALIEEIPMNTLHLIVSQTLRHKLAGRRPERHLKGQWLHNEDNYHTSHPYIALASSRDVSGFGTVCLDKHTDDIWSAFNKDDLLSASYLLLQWAQYYNTKYANPYNQPALMHLGAPKDMSDEYLATQSKNSIIDNTNTAIMRKATKLEGDLDMNLIQKNEWIVNEYDRIDCRWKNDQPAYHISKQTIDSFNSESWFVYEACIMEVLESLKSNEDIWETNGDIINSEVIQITGTSGFNVYNCYDDDDGTLNWYKVEEMIKDRLTKYYIVLARNTEDDECLRKEFCSYTREYLIKIDILENEVLKDKQTLDTTESSDAKMMELMKTWAESSERSR